MSVLDMPDNYPWLPGSHRSPLADLGELAARLGSIDTYDRRGAVLFLDGMEHGMSPYVDEAVGAGGSREVVASPTVQGGFSMKLATRTSTPFQVDLTKRVQPLGVDNVGVEATWSLDTVPSYFRANVQWNTGVVRRRWRAQVYLSPQEVRVLEDDGSLTAFATHTIVAGDPLLFHTFKLVVDADSLAYVRFMLDQVEYDLSEYSAEVVADATDARVEFGVALVAEDATQDVAYVDSLVITTGEP